MNLINNVLSQSAFWIVNKALTRHLKGDHAAVLLLAELISLRQLAEANGKLDQDGFFPVLGEYLEEAVCIGRHARVKATAKLKDVAWVSLTPKKTQTPDKGIQTINWYGINDDIIEKFLKEHKGAVCNNFTPRREQSYPPYVINHTADKILGREEEGEDFKDEVASNQVTSCKASTNNKVNSSLDNISPPTFREDMRARHTSLSPIKESVQEPQLSHPRQHSIEDLILSWSAHLPAKILNDRQDHLYTLFYEIKEAGHTKDDLSLSLKKRIMDKLVPAKRPQKTTQEAYETWLRMAGDDYDRQLALVFLPALTLRSAPEAAPAEVEQKDISEISFNTIMGIINITKKNKE